jgi:hypothetical protein
MDLGVGKNAYDDVRSSDVIGFWAGLRLAVGLVAGCPVPFFSASSSYWILY